MIKVERIGVYNVGNALHGMRHPLESWDQSDSYYDKNNVVVIGEKDLKLAQRLIKAGTDHRKFMRQIFVSMDITAPMTFWWDFDTYKISTVRNSTSRMHKLGTRLLTENDFSWKHMSDFKRLSLAHINDLILQYQFFTRNGDTKSAKDVWEELIEDLLESYDFTSTWTGNFENLRNIYFARRNHKQQELRDFCVIIEKLDYSELITTE